MNTKKKLAIASLVASILSLIPNIVLPESLSLAQILIIVCIFIALAGVVLGFIGKSEAKGLSIAGIIIGIISCILLCFSLIGFFGMQNATDCVDKGNGFSTCNYLGQEIEVPNEYLREDQMKK